VILPCSTAGVYYQFTGIPTDSFRIKAAVSNDSLYSFTGYVPTYHTSSFYWDTATGPGFIAGNVTMGANKGTSAAIPDAGLLIFALNQATGALIEQTYTDAGGNFSFSNLATGVTYEIYPEHINFTTTPYTNITLTASADSVSNINFIQHNISLTITPVNSSISNIPAPTLTYIFILTLQMVY